MSVTGTEGGGPRWWPAGHGDGLRAGACASLAAGAIHATAVGVHGEHRQAAVAFAAVALFQLIWGAAALVRPGAAVARAGAVGNGAAVGGWLLAKTTGIPFVDGLEQAERLQLTDTVAAALGAVAVIGALGVLRAPAWAQRAPRPLPVVAATGVAMLVLVSMVAAGEHSHGAGAHDAHGGDAAHGHDGGDASGHGHDDTHDDGPAGHGDHMDASGHGDGADGHDVGHAGSPGHDADDHAAAPHDAGQGGAHDEHGGGAGSGGGGHSGDGHGGDGGGGGGHGGDHGPRPYDATLPVDLGGVPGVSAEQQARAEAVVTDALINLPQFADPAVAEAAGYRSIGDGFTGYEHFVNWPLLGDGRILDADRPESLVYQTDGGGRTLVSAMYFLETGTTLADAPDVGGPLTQWHVHNDLCFTGEADAWRLGTVMPPSSPCPGGQFRLDLPPMIHVWIVPHRCGPFAALDGIAGGQVGEGEQVLCDHAHGSGGL
jgi:hypothetical protein